VLPIPPVDVYALLAGDIPVAQVGAVAAACVTVKLRPAIVSVPERLLATVFADTLKLTGPDPDPDAPLAIVIHDAPLDAVQPQPVPAVTVLLPVPPAAVKD
jgi:hypothetical protein